MSAVVEQFGNDSSIGSDIVPHIVIGSGPVGMRVASSLLKNDPHCKVIVFGDEPWQAYNRVKLSSLLVGESTWEELLSEEESKSDRLVCQYNCRIIKIDRANKTVTDIGGTDYRYSSLVIATGSHPHIPNIKGVRAKGVYTFRNMRDAEHLVARQARSRHTVIIGGGLLGLEAARAMQQKNTEVTVIEHTDRLLSSQLDYQASELLREHVLSLGIQVLLGDGVKEIHSDVSVTGLTLLSGRAIECDTIVIAAGIRPNIQLAREANLRVGRGIRVNDQMRTTAADIYAVGECAEHNEIVYGLVAPGYEQAEVAVNTICGKKVRYTGSVSATRLKVLNCPVFSMGETAENYSPIDFKIVCYNRPESGIYRKLVIKNGKLVGAVAVGLWAQLNRIQEVITNRRRLWRWQLRRFETTGELWPDEASLHVQDWPAGSMVCNCTGVTRGELSKWIGKGCSTVSQLRDCTGASSVCGSCRPLLEDLTQCGPTVERDKYSIAVLGFSVVGFLLALITIVLNPIPYSTSVESGWHWDILWRDSTLKQVSGFSLLGFSFLLLGVSLRKRVKKISFGNFSLWRLLHIAIGAAVIIVLLAHTGFRFGENLNQYLMLTFVALLSMGILAGGVIGVGHKLDAVIARRIKTFSIWTHIFLFWPIPVLLGFHIFKTYYF